MVIRDRSFRIDNSTVNSRRVVMDLTLDCSCQSEADDVLRFLERMANPVLEVSNSGAPLVDRRSGAVINPTPRHDPTRYDPDYRANSSRNVILNRNPIIAMNPPNRSENIEDVNEYSSERGDVAREVRVDDESFGVYRANTGAGDGYVENAPTVFFDRPIPRNAIIAGEEMVPSAPVQSTQAIQPILPVVVPDINPITDLDIT